MSEYMLPQKNDSVVPAEGTLFNDDLIDEIAREGNLSTAEVRQQYGIEPPREQEPTSGASVTLVDRAIAIDGIINGINRRNQANGASQQAEGLDNNFRRRYQHPDEVAAIMRSNAKLDDDKREGQLDTLNATTAMIKAGFDPDDVTFYKNRVRDELKQLEGTGSKNAHKRRQFNEKVQATAKNARR
ncbi:MAG: hypothetical protein EOT05_00810 [Candidatus Microsaccharimonas sossegonensis]|uniref:Uncharacterized protein n=1 Tax=Candidatus Microsaccharimonas sossegonensis TaxID=2506948 RepID=A0A4Q0AH20_9BACT|nr:MAG: hypothetical protein EOT05_00810 [Candidatus Microsaccharimonas sossegonensis]